MDQGTAEEAARSIQEVKRSRKVMLICLNSDFITSLETCNSVIAVFNVHKIEDVRKFHYVSDHVY